MPHMSTSKSSRIPSFYKKSVTERLTDVAYLADLSPEETAILAGGRGLSIEEADHMIENVIGLQNLPLAVATNFLINGKDYLIPLSVEEPSVVAALSNAARMFRESGGFQTSSDEPIMIGQIQVLDLNDLVLAEQRLMAAKDDLLKAADETGGSIVARGGGARDIEVRAFPDTPVGPMLTVHLLFDCREAMGANAVNTAAEHIAPLVEEITGGRVNLRILSNLTDRRKARAEGVVPASMLESGDISGAQAVQYIVEAGVLAEIDPYRAATHNKGIMNGIDAVLLATANDWRAVEAGAHAYAARDGLYRSLTTWRKNENGDLHGSIELPLAVGIVGGATRVHPTARIAMKILSVQSARELAEVLAVVGLAQNFAAIRALATEGIQRGHMRMHARQLAVAAGAEGALVSRVADQLVRENRIRLERATQLVDELKGD